MSLQHLHVRKRGRKSLEPYPARSRWMRALDTTIYCVGVIGPVTTVPQLILIYGGHNATGVSVISFLGAAILDLPWVVYGLAHREKPIVMTYTLWFLCNLAVAIGALLYGGSVGF